MNKHIFPPDAPATDWRRFIPFAKAQVAEFLRKQDPGRWRKDELQSVAFQALATGKPSATWARKAIKGALNDYVRDEHKLVHDVEMAPGEFERPWGEPEEPEPHDRAARIDKLQRAIVRVERNVTYLKPGPYRTNARLLSMGRVESKHWKVRTAPTRLSYIDGIAPSAGRVRASVTDDDEANLEHDTRAAEVSARGTVDQAAYPGKGREQRFAVACLNDGRDFNRGLDAPAPRYVKPLFAVADPARPSVSTTVSYRRDDGALMVRTADDCYVNSGSLYQDPEVDDDAQPPAARGFASRAGGVRVKNPNLTPDTNAAFRYHFTYWPAEVWPRWRYRRASTVRVDMDKRSIEPVPMPVGRPRGAWLAELVKQSAPRAKGPSWHREAGYSGRGAGLPRLAPMQAGWIWGDVEGKTCVVARIMGQSLTLL